LPASGSGDGIIPPSCANPASCALVFKFIPFRSLHSRDTGEFPVNRTYKVVVVQRLREVGGLVTLRFVSCEAHPKADEWPVNWPSSESVLAGKCPRQGNGQEVLPVVAYSLYKRGHGTICTLDVLKDNGIATFSRAWELGVADQSCLTEFVN
jgi:hypothetical protein